MAVPLFPAIDQVIAHYYGYDIDVKVNDSGKYAWFVYLNNQLQYSSGYEYSDQSSAFDCACSRIDTLGY